MAKDETEILAFCRRWAAAIVGNDAAAIGGFATDDWVIVGTNGVTGREEFLRSIATGDLTHDRMEFSGDPRIRVHGETALVTSRIVNSGRYRGHPFTADEWTTDVLIRRNGRWLCALTHLTPADAPAVALSA